MPRPRPLPGTLPLLQLLPNLITLLGLCAGLTAVRFTLDGRFEPATALIVFAALIDGLDGLIARRFNAASHFGAELDSLADFVNFGVAPALLVYELALSGTTDVAWTAALIFSVCACLRLARFNVARNLPVVGRAHFIGVPAPAGALLALLPAYVHFAGIADITNLAWLAALWLAFVGILMISRLRTVALKGLRISRTAAPWLAVGVALVVGLTFSRFWLLLILLDLAYLASLAYAMATARRPRPSVKSGD